MGEHHSILYGPINALLVRLLGEPPVEKLSSGMAAFFFPDFLAMDASLSHVHPQRMVHHGRSWSRSTRSATRSQASVEVGRSGFTPTG